ncbi:glycosyltransferase [Acinetobacter pullicarnis]|uniref:glycosyltransferase n=1 Tax=Acinetobacter pullicarnis TaxID=2576829 RepID=UPI0011240119|nr:glycosyltransferase [Acinetobacter pullicarnis]
MLSYFLNSPFGYKLTGIEHASLKRYKLFKEMGLACNIVTMNYSTELQPICNLHNIEYTDFINLYKSYQGFDRDLIYTLQDFLQTLHQPEVKPVLNIETDHKVFVGGVYVMYIRCFKGTDRVSYINYFNPERQKVRRELYDYLGYKSCEVILFNNKVLQQNHYDANQQIYLIVNHHEDKKSYTLQHKNKKLFFANETALQQHWLETLIQGNTYFFIDKNRIYNSILAEIKNDDLKKIAIIHSTHTSNPNMSGNKKVNSNYKYLLDNQQHFSACVVGTQAQYLDLIADFNMSIPVYVIPPSYISEYRKNTQLESETFRILSIGRIATEKRHEDMVMAMKTVVQTIQNARLEFFGSGDIKQIDRIKALINEHGLQEYIFLKDYVHDIKSELFNAQLSLVTSKVESFCIAILDSLEQGTPVISYDIKYGPSSIIQDGVNGKLVAHGDVESLSSSIIDYYRNNMFNYSDNTQLVLDEYSSQKVSSKWKDLLNDLNRTDINHI